MFWRAIEAASRHWATVPPSMSATPAAGHAGTRAALDLTPGDFGGEGRGLRDEHADEPGGEHGLDDLLARQSQRAAHADQRAGSPPHDPAVGAATMTPIALFTSMIAVMYLVTLLNRSLGRSVLFRCPASIRCACGPRMRSAYSVPASPSSTAFSMMPTSRSILLKMSSSVVLPRTLS